MADLIIFISKNDINDPTNHKFFSLSFSFFEKKNQFAKFHPKTFTHDLYNLVVIISMLFLLSHVVVQ